MLIKYEALHCKNGLKNPLISGKPNLLPVDSQMMLANNPT